MGGLHEREEVYGCYEVLIVRPSILRVSDGASSARAQFFNSFLASRFDPTLLDAATGIPRCPFPTMTFEVPWSRYPNGLLVNATCCVQPLCNVAPDTEAVDGGASVTTLGAVLGILVAIRVIL